jgi:hypothetical protein
MFIAKQPPDRRAAQYWQHQMESGGMECPVKFCQGSMQFVVPPPMLLVGSALLSAENWGLQTTSGWVVLPLMLLPGPSKLANERSLIMTPFPPLRVIRVPVVSTRNRTSEPASKTYSTTLVSGNRAVFASQRGVISDPYAGSGVVLDSGANCPQEATINDNDACCPATLNRAAGDRLTTVADNQTAPVRVVLNDVAAKFSTGSTDCHAIPSGTLDRVST